MRCLFALIVVLSSLSHAAAQDSLEANVERLLERLKDNERPIWTYESLAANADLIVIATLVDKQETAHDTVGETDFDRESTRRFLNKLDVLSVLKGEVRTEINVVTTEWGPKSVVLGLRTRLVKLRKRMLFPNLVAVVLADEVTDWGIMENSEKIEIVPPYLLYLKNTGIENTFVPVTGQRWSADSVRNLDNDTNF